MVMYPTSICKKGKRVTRLSKYTTTVKDICESFIPGQELWSMDLSVQRIIDKTQGNFFDFDFPLNPISFVSLSLLLSLL